MVFVLLELAEHEEEERSHIPVKVFVIQKQFRQVAQVLTVHWILQSVDLEHLNECKTTAMRFSSSR